MRKKIYLGKRQLNKLRTKILFICSVISFVILLTAGGLVFININNLSKTKASGSGSGGGGNELNNGDIISEFKWDKENVLAATLGPDAFQSNTDVHGMPGGMNSSPGLSPGSKGKDINLVIKEGEIFNKDGIDISIDYRRSEPTGDFFSRGSVFNFGMENGFITISYCTENKIGKKECISEKTNYEIPNEPVFRTYRFIYTPTTGKAEIFVNNIIVWQHQTEINTPLLWKNAGNIIIGRNMNGGGIDRPIFDNLVVRSNGSLAPFAETLLNFMLETKDGGVKIHWSTSINEKVDYFIIERSLNGNDFTNVININAKPDSLNDEEYTFLDKTPTPGRIVYYRLRQVFKNGKVAAHPLSAIKFDTDKEFAIERISPSPFKKSCDISYFIPKSGLVWMQIADEKGSIIKTSNFEARTGKNVHVFTDDGNLQSGIYTVSLIFDNKKISAKMKKYN